MMSRSSHIADINSCGTVNLPKCIDNLPRGVRAWEDRDDRGSVLGGSKRTKALTENALGGLGGFFPYESIIKTQQLYIRPTSGKSSQCSQTDIRLWRVVVISICDPPTILPDPPNGLSSGNLPGLPANAAAGNSPASHGDPWGGAKMFRAISPMTATTNSFWEKWENLFFGLAAALACRSAPLRNFRLGIFISAFVVAIGGKADMPFCSAHVR